ncbi:DUF3298 and DUF4163 domain-containing protein [Chryseobacterium gossypii]|uniref:DUF3298 and DUF4163 domain-containing protein n=1 Tax=Chryseobacterium gossypii TaxID=3231602 RepID=UPI003526B016
MRNTIAITALLSLLAFSACKKTGATDNTNTQTENQQAEKFVIDSVAVNDSIKITDSLSLKYSSKLLVFPSIKDQKLLDSIYFTEKGIKDFSKNGLQAYLEKDKNEYYNSIKQDSKNWGSDITYSQHWYTDSDMTVKSNINDFLHIQYFNSSYEGGAHDNYGFSERVFDLKNNKKVGLKDITTMPKAEIEKLLMKNINKMNGGATDEKGQINNSDMLLVEVIPATDNFYFDDKNLYFHYSPYEIAAFAAGDITIPVSWEELKASLTPQFKERMKIK